LKENKEMKIGLALVIVAILAGCQSVQNAPSSTAVMKSMTVNGTNITYMEQGTGVPVVLVHGAYADHRIWEPQREAVAQRYRFIAIDQRYFGVAPWSDNGANLSQSTHIADLAAFIRGLNVGPVHVVARSYGANIALSTAVRNPELFRSLFAHEGILVSIITDNSIRSAVVEDRKGLVAVAATAKAGKALEATKMLHEFVNDSPGSFDKLGSREKTMAIENARTVGPQFTSSPPPPISCAEFGKLNMPVTLTHGELTRASFKAAVMAQHSCLPSANIIIIPGATHGAPGQNPQAFNEALLTFLARH
jgi:pimeloyl-ACP methyl ester carboxylesterase